MWTLKRRERSRSQGPAEPEFAIPESDVALAAEIDRLTDAHERQPSFELAARLLALRNAAGVRRLRDPTPDPRHPEPDTGSLPEGAELPEFTRENMTPELLRAAILRDGCLLVRGLFAAEDAERYARRIDEVYAAREAFENGRSYDRSLYWEFAPQDGVGQEMARPWIKEGGGVLAADSPALSFELQRLFRAANLPALVQAYLGEPPLITGQKTTLRIAEPSIPGAWHQDGKFMGPVRALNLWVALSRCGDVAPGLDIVPRRIEDYVTTQTDEALLAYSISQRQAELAAGERAIVRPVFQPGDAIFFDELFLHKTGSDPAMPQPRYAIENWFFGASSFPADYAPIVV